MKILMIGAHQDDNEFRCGGIAYKLVQKGHEVRFLSMCNGCGGHHVMTPAETTATRAKESAAVAQLLGVSYDVWDDQQDCALVADLETRRRLIRYIRKFSPDVIIAHRTNDYHADHRASGQLVMDASYMLIVPHECPDVPAMKKTPIIMYNEDNFTDPEFRGDLVVDIDDAIEKKLHMAHLNVCQVYEWLPYTSGQLDEIPEDEEGRFKWLCGMEIDKWYSDEDVMSRPMPISRGIRFARPAARFRNKLIEEYGEERGSKVRFAEAFQVCEYGSPMTDEVRKEFLSL